MQPSLIEGRLNLIRHLPSLTIYPSSSFYLSLACSSHHHPTVNGLPCFFWMLPLDPFFDDAKGEVNIGSYKDKIIFLYIHVLSRMLFTVIFYHFSITPHNLTPISHKFIDAPSVKLMRLTHLDSSTFYASSSVPDSSSVPPPSQPPGPSSELPNSDPLNFLSSDPFDSPITCKDLFPNLVESRSIFNPV